MVNCGVDPSLKGDLRPPSLRIWYPHPQPPPPSRGRGLWGGGCAPAARQGGIASLAPFEPPS